MAKEGKPRIIRYTDRKGAIYERNSQGGGIVLDGSDPISVAKMGYFSQQTIADLAEPFKARRGRGPTLGEIADILFFSTQLGDIPGGTIVFFNPQTKKYERSHTVANVEIKQ